jgi:hypothetical protein
MFIMDIPYVPVQQTPIVLVQAATLGVVTTPQPDFILKECQETEHATTAFSGVDPAGMIKNFIENRDKHYVDLATIKIALLQGPSHGELAPGTSEYARSSYTYDPESDYIGKDSAVFMAEFEGKRYKIVVDIVVVEQVVENPVPAGEKPVCPPPKLIKVNGKPASSSLDIDLNGKWVNSMYVRFPKT